MRQWYFYLHENGQLIGKNPALVDIDPDYFDSSFVRKVWKIDLDNQVQCALVLEDINEIRREKKLDELKDLRRMQ